MLDQSKAKDLAARLVTRWRPDPAAMCGDIFTNHVIGEDGRRVTVPMRLWRRQVEILHAVAANRRVAVRSGHKCGKTAMSAALAWWWVLTRPRGRVILTAPSYTQVDEVLWTEIKRLYRSSRIPIGGRIGIKPDTGWEAPDGRQIIGLSTDKPERAAGFSGPHVLIVIDEASGYDPKIFEALKGNLAGGAHILLLSNPTQNSGFFFDAFHQADTGWKTIHMSSVECAQSWPTDIGPHPIGLATMEWCNDMLRDYGEDDARYQVRVLGNFPTQADNAMVSAAFVSEAVKRWTPNPPAEGRLCIGVDVARYGADETAIIFSRGKWASKPIVLKGFDNVDVAAEVVRVARENVRPNERASVRVDTTNNGGVADILRREKNVMLSVQEIIYAASSTVDGYSRMRDQLWGSLREWLKTGGAIPPDTKLRDDIVAPTFKYDVRNQIKVEAKDDMRSRIGRSTDRADALALAVFPANAADDVARKVFSDKHREPSSRW